MPTTHKYTKDFGLGIMTSKMSLNWQLLKIVRVSANLKMRSMRCFLLTIAFALTVTSGFAPLVESSNVEFQNGAASGAQDSAASVYVRKCATCHGKDGHARTFKAKLNSARDLTDSQWHADVSDERIFNSISNGRGKMPAFGKKMSEAVIESLVSYVRGLKK